MTLVTLRRLMVYVELTTGRGHFALLTVALVYVGRVRK
jgi:hypothetical protein